MKNIFSKSYFLFIKMLFACLLVCILYINILFALFVILFVCALISIVCTRKCENMTLSDKKFFIILFFVVVFVACVLCSYTSLYAAGSVWTWPWQHDWCRVAQSQRQQVTTTPRWRNESLLWQTLHIDTRHRHNDMQHIRMFNIYIVHHHIPHALRTWYLSTASTAILKFCLSD